MEANVRQLCSRIVADPDKCSNEDEKDAYAYLEVQVKATPESADIKGYLDPNVLTTARTSGCLICLYYNHSTRKESLKILPTPAV